MYFGSPVLYHHHSNVETCGIIVPVLLYLLSTNYQADKTSLDFAAHKTNVLIHSPATLFLLNITVIL